LFYYSNCFRLLQNRKSAKKCRQKKKAEFNKLRENYEKLSKENEELKNKVRT